MSRKRLLKICFVCFPALILVILGCGGHTSGGDDKPNANAPYIVKETIATGDTGITRLAGIKRVNELDILCQHWELAKEGISSSSPMLYDKNYERIYPELNIFTDSGYMENPRSHVVTGTWRIIKHDGMLGLTLRSTDKEKNFYINELRSRSLKLATIDNAGDTLYLDLSSDGLIHKNRLNDPFHPVNNQWRMPPLKPENDSAIAARAKQCVKFYALFYRDNILRQKDKINFAGLPVIFEWYRRGIGMPDWEDIHDSWVHCFYDKDQARKGYDVLRKVIVDYEFVWPKGLPDWRMETENVLEQMYHKM